MNILRKLREDKHLSQEQLAAMSGLSIGTIQRMESRSRASVESLKSLASALKSTMEITMKFILASGLIFLSRLSFATTCIAVDGELDVLSKKYERAVSIEVIASDNEADVKISAPLTVEGREFNSALVVRGDPNTMKFEFMFPLSAQKGNEGVVLFYMVSEELLTSNFIELTYGNGCGKVIRYAVRT